jgi:signal peptidase I
VSDQTGAPQRVPFPRMLTCKKGIPMPHLSRSRLRKFFREHLAPALLVLIVLGSFRSAIADWNVVSTGSMNPTILEGDHIFVNKLAYGLRVPFTDWELAHWSSPGRGEVVIFRSPADGTRLVKRVIAGPGDTVAMVNNALLINGMPASYELLGGALGVTLPGAQLPHTFASERFGGINAPPHIVMATPALPARRNFGPLTVPAGQYFVMGDNRDNSADSRYFGFVSEHDIIGRSSHVLYSLDVDRFPLPRWGRTWEPIR